MEYCKHDMPAALCGDCNPGIVGPDDTMIIANRRIQPSPWIEAQFPGRCSSCPTRIRPGMHIRSDGEGGWLCTGCGEEMA